MMIRTLLLLLLIGATGISFSAPAAALMLSPQDSVLAEASERAVEEWSIYG
ncbi:hypothetical protein LCGC14_2851610, partial [marine sediment metagenome]